MSAEWQIVRTQDDVARCDGKRVVVIGEYCAIVRPTKGMSSQNRPKDRAVVMLTDTTRVYLEPFDSDQSQRPSSELQAFDHKRVRVRGTLHAQMPSRGESLIAPCIAGVEQIEEEA